MIKRFLTSLAFVAALFVSAPLMAQSVPNEAQAIPLDLNNLALEGWVHDLDKQDNQSGRLAVYKDKNENTIEVLGKQFTKLENNAKFFQEAFDKNLMAVGQDNNKNSFVREGSPETITVGGSEGVKYSYTYDSAIKIHVEAVHFTKNNYVFVIVGYFSDKNSDEGREAFKKFLSKIK